MCQDLQEQLDVAQATLDQKEHDMLLVSQGRTLSSVRFFHFFKTCCIMAEASEVGLPVALLDCAPARPSHQPSNRFLQLAHAL